MLGPLVILPLLSICGGWIGIERFAAFLTPSVVSRIADSGGGNLELVLSIAAVGVAILGWFFAYLFYKQDRNARQNSPPLFPALTSFLAHKYYIDEL